MTVTVLITTYNYAGFISQAIHSVLEQETGPHRVELLVIDDGSTDDTQQVLQPLIADGKVQYHYQPNSGKAVATQKGIELATGDFIFILDADDWFLPGKIRETLAIFQQYPRVVHVGGPALIVWEDGHRQPKPEPVPDNLLATELQGAALLYIFYHQNMLFGGGSTFAAKASVLKQISWNSGIDMYTDEWLLMQTLLKGNSYFLPVPYSVWRVHKQNYSAVVHHAQKQSKIQRLQAASNCMLQMLAQKGQPGWLHHAYALRHAIRYMVWQEQLGTKTWQDRWLFARQYLLSFKYPLRQLKYYKAFNRVVK